jgi:hypothetical protein
MFRSSSVVQVSFITLILYNIPAYSQILTTRSKKTNNKEYDCYQMSLKFEDHIEAMQRYICQRVGP